MAIRKSIEFFGPYIASTFNDKTAALSGLNGMVSGGEVTVVTPTTVDIGPYQFVQEGVLVTKTDTTSGVTVPSSGLVHIVVSSPDELNSSGVTLTVVETNEEVSENNILIASRVNNNWVHAPKLSLSEVSANAVDVRADALKGRIEDAKAIASSNIGTNQAIRQGYGIVTEGDGTKQELRGDYSLGAHAQFEINTLDPDFIRNDHVVLREPKEGSNIPAQLIRAQGETIRPGYDKFAPAPTASVNVNAAASNTAPTSETNAAGEYVVVWTNTGSNLIHLDRRAHTPARGSASTSSISAGGAVGPAYLAVDPHIGSGDRLYGCVASGGEIAVFRTDPDGVGFTAGDVQVLTSLANTALAPYMVLSEDRQFGHIVFQYDETGAGRYQVYYMKVDLTDANWGGSMVAVSPRIARGSDGGNNDTDPRVAIDNDGLLHVTFVQGTAPATVGDIVYLTLTDAGIVIDAATAVSTDVYAEGTGSYSVTSNSKPRICCTPQNEVYVVWRGISAGVIEQVCFFTPELYDRTGFKSARIGQLTTAGATASTVHWHDAFSDQLGRLCYFCAHNDDIIGDRFFFIKLNPVPLRDNISISPDTITKPQHVTTADLSYSALTGVADQQDEGGEARLDRDGSLLIADLISGTTVTNRKFSSSHLIGINSQDFGKQHPRDSYVSTVTEPWGSINVVQEENRLNVRPRRVKNKSPITAVDLNGDYAGFNSIQQAINSLKNEGGKVIVRGGYHPIVSQLRLWSGIELIADGHVVLDLQGGGLTPDDSAIVCHGLGDTGANVAVINPDKHIVRIDVGTNLIELGLRAGDIVYLYDTAEKPEKLSNLVGPFCITNTWDKSNEYYVLNQDIDPFISGMTDPHALVYSTGIVIDGFTILDNRGGSSKPIIDTEYLYRASFRRLVIESEGASPTISAKAGFDCKFLEITASSNVRAIDVNSDSANFSVQDIRTNIESCTFNGNARFGESTYVEELQVTGCQVLPPYSWEVGTDQLANATTTPTWTNNAGSISASSFDNIANWAEDGSAFVNRIIFNQDSAVESVGHLQGAIINLKGDLKFHTDDTHQLGTGLTNRAANLFASRVSVSPTTTTDHGVRFFPNNLGTPTQIDQGICLEPHHRYLEMSDPNEQKTMLRLEAYGRLARTHHLVDDFHYRDPTWYNTTGELVVGITNGSSNSLESNISGSGGVVRQILNGIGSDQVTIASARDWTFNRSTRQWCHFVARYALGSNYDSTDRDNFIGFRQVGGNLIGFHRTGGVATPWSGIVDLSRSGGGTAYPPVNFSNAPTAADQFLFFYLATTYIDGPPPAIMVYFYISGESAPLYIAVPIAGDMTLMENSPWEFFVDLNNKTSSTGMYDLLDYIEVWDTFLLSEI